MVFRPEIDLLTIIELTPKHVRYNNSLVVHLLARPGEICLCSEDFLGLLTPPRKTGLVLRDAMRQESPELSRHVEVGRDDEAQHEQQDVNPHFLP